MSAFIDFFHILPLGFVTGFINEYNYLIALVLGSQGLRN
jgi:hypothetical protein